MAFNRLIDVSKKYFEIRLNKINLIKTIIVLVMVLITYYINNLYLNIISLLIAIIFAWNINKKTINTIINMVIYGKCGRKIKDDYIHLKI